MKKRFVLFRFIISIRMEVIRLIKVKAYKRVRNGKVEKVRSHLRRY